MELRDFIKETIIQIADGLNEGHKYVIENDLGDGIRDDCFEEINFDVAISTNEEEVSGVDGKISVAKLLSFGSNDESKYVTSNLSRIRFKTLLHVKTKG